MEPNTNTPLKQSPISTLPALPRAYGPPTELQSRIDAAFSDCADGFWGGEPLSMWPINWLPPVPLTERMTMASETNTTRDAANDNLPDSAQHPTPNPG